MAAGRTELWIGARCNGMSYMKFRAVHIDHVVAEFPHLVGNTGLVEFHTIFLFIAG
jgi:hypothetical protein